ncbi:phage tail fiber domain-containing protein [Burkholderia cepacia]|uniref:phage tail fiber domain-containing protein n=1 Tax=Burkholderia cepacia TaxID=292 RepID=UPI001CF27354|nr:phage tail fiber protein [Burkholderia cepacia]MCA8058145.1 hypothetical protein [Burkholderia cepacia]
MPTTKLSLLKRRLQIQLADRLPLVGDGKNWAVTTEDLARFVGPYVPVSEELVEAAQVATEAADRAQASTAAIGSGTSPDAGDLLGSEIVPVSRGNGLLQTTWEKVAAFILSIFTIAIGTAVGIVSRSIIAELLDLPVSVKRFGAKGDGITDDTVAFANAQATGCPVYVPYSRDGYVIGNLDVTGIVYSNGRTQLIPAPGSKWMARVKGYGSCLRGFTINDITGNVVAKSTTTSACALGATSIPMTTVEGFFVGQRVMIEGNTGFWHTTWITAVGSSTITLQNGLAYAVSSEARVWASFGAVYVTADSYVTAHAMVDELTFPNCWAGVMLDCGSIIGSADVMTATVRRIRGATARLFGVIKGRNVHDTSFKDIRIYGGWGVAANYVGDGSRRDFQVSDNIWLKRELTVKVNGVVKTVDVDYSFAGPRAITFNVAPANGAAVSLSGWTYGADGVVDDGQSTVTATGGNTYDDVYMLQFARGAKLVAAQLYQFGVCAFDTCSESALELNSTVFIGQLANVFLGYSPALIRAVNGAVGARALPSVYNRLPANVTTDGAGGSVIVCDATSSIEFPGAVPLGAYSGAAVVGANTTGYLGPAGYQTNQGAGQWSAPIPGAVLKMTVGSGTPPGAGQSFTYNLMVNGVVKATTVISGTGTFDVVTYPGIGINSRDLVTVQLVTSATASQGQHRVNLLIG